MKVIVSAKSIDISEHFQDTQSVKVVQDIKANHHLSTQTTEAGVLDIEEGIKITKAKVFTKFI